MELNFFRKRCVGVDIGSKNIKLVSLKPTAQKKFSLEFWKTVELPDNLVNIETPIENKAPIIIDQIKSIYSHKKNLPKSVAISVSGTPVIVRYIKLPVMTKEELSKSISLEVEPYIPFPVNEVYLSFDIIGEVLDEGIKKNEVVVAAAKKDYINAQIDILSQCGLVPKYIDVDVFVLENLVNYNYNTENEIMCIVNIGANVTSVGIIDNGITKVCRDLPLGMLYILNEMKKNRQLEYKDIINYLKSDGLILTDEEKEMYISQDKKTELMISKELLSLLKEFSTELHKIIDFYYFQKGEQKPLSKIFLSGGGCIIRNLAEYFSKEFKTEVEILDPFKNIDNSDDVPSDLRPIFAVAVGLAMKCYIHR